MIAVLAGLVVAIAMVWAAGAIAIASLAVSDYRMPGSSPESRRECAERLRGAPKWPIRALDDLMEVWRAGR